MSNPVWIEFTDGWYYRMCSARPASGPLEGVHRPSVLRTSGGALVLLSGSAGMHHVGAEAEAVLGELAQELADTAWAEGLEGGRQAVVHGVLAACEAGRFGRGLPEVLCILCDGETSAIWSAGPNGSGTVGPSGLRRVSADPRWPALHEAGLTTHGPGPTDPLAWEYTGITVFELDGLKLQAWVGNLTGGCVLLMSKGALPFRARFEFEDAATFWGRDAAWRHGLGATVVAVGRKDGMEEADRGLDAWRKELGDRAEPERRPPDLGAIGRSDARAGLEAVALRLLDDPSPLIQARGMVMCVHLHLKSLEPVVRRFFGSEETFEGKDVEASLGKLARSTARALHRYRPDPTFPDWPAVAVGAPDIAPDEDLDDDADHRYLAVRATLLSDVPSGAPPGAPFAVVMESGLAEMTHTLVVTRTRVFSLRSSGLMESSRDAWPSVHAAAEALLDVAPHHWDDLEPTGFAPRPAHGASRFLLLSPAEVRCTPAWTWKDAVAIVEEGRALAPLIGAAHAVIAAHQDVERQPVTSPDGR